MIDPQDEMIRQQKHASKIGARLFRNNVGLGWTGRVIDRKPDRMTIAEPRPLHAGLLKGSGDLIGWTPLVITPEMVGKTIAIFSSVETKTGSGRATKDQRAWDEMVRMFGGYSGFARSNEDVEKILLGG